MSGVATLETATAEAFVPQMLNYESVGGVSFSKGCYPGQEVVARSQFRGTLKRRAYLVQSAQPLAAGQELFHDSDPGQPCGLIAQAAAHPQAGWARHRQPATSGPSVKPAGKPVPTALCSTGPALCLLDVISPAALLSR